MCLPWHEELTVGRVFLTKGVLGIISPDAYSNMFSLVRGTKYPDTLGPRVSYLKYPDTLGPRVSYTKYPDTPGPRVSSIQNILTH